MKKTMLLAGFLVALGVQAQSIDFSSLDKLAAKAKEVNTITLDQNQLRAALQMLPSSQMNAQQMQQLKKLASGLTSVAVRNFEFEKPGQFSEADLQPIRSQIAKQQGWSKIVDSKEEDEHSEIFMLTQNDKPAGLAVIAAEEDELSVVIVKGALTLNDLGSLGGLAGLPSMRLGPQQATTKK